MEKTKTRKTKDIKLYARISEPLNERVENLCDYLSCSKANFASMAISYYVIYQENQMAVNNPDFVTKLLQDDTTMSKLAEMLKNM